MASGLQRGRPKAGGVLVTVAGGVLLLRALPLMRAYAHKLSAQHSAVRARRGRAGRPGRVSPRLARNPSAAPRHGSRLRRRCPGDGGPLRKPSRRSLPRPRSSGRLSSSATRPSGCSPARRPGEGDLHAVFAAGAVSAGTLVLLLGEAGLPGAPALAVLAVARPASALAPHTGRLGSRAPGRASSSRRRAAGARSGLARPRGAFPSGDVGGSPRTRPVLGRPRVPPAGSARHRGIRARPSAARPRAAIASLARPRRLSRAGLPLRRRAGGKSGPVPPVRDGPLRLRRGARSRAPARGRRSVGPDRPGARGLSRPRCCSSARRTWTGPPRSSSRRRPRSSRSGRRAPGVSASPAFSSAARSRSRSSRSSLLRRSSCSRCVGPGHGPRHEDRRRGALRVSAARAVDRMEPCAGRLRGGALRVVSRRAPRACRARALLHALAGFGSGSREPGSARAPGEHPPPSVRCGLPIEPLRSQWRRLQRAAAAAAPRGPRRVGRAAQSPVSRRGAALSRALVAALSPVDPISLSRLSSLRGLHGRGAPPAHGGLLGCLGPGRRCGRAGGGRGVSGALRLERARVEGRIGPRDSRRNPLGAASVSGIRRSSRTGGPGRVRR